MRERREGLTAAEGKVSKTAESPATVPERSSWKEDSTKAKNSRKIAGHECTALLRSDTGNGAAMIVTEDESESSPISLANPELNSSSLKPGKNSAL